FPNISILCIFRTTVQYGLRYWHSFNVKYMCNFCTTSCAVLRKCSNLADTLMLNSRYFICMCIYIYMYAIKYDYPFKHYTQKQVPIRFYPETGKCLKVGTCHFATYECLCSSQHSKSVS